MSYATVTLTGKILTQHGQAQRGSVGIFTNVGHILDASGNVILTGAVQVTLDSTGAFSVALPATDEPNLSPNGFQYTLRAPGGISVTFSLPTTPSTVDLADLVPIAPAPVAAASLTDATVAALINNAASSVRAALAEEVETGGLAYAENITGTLTAFTTALVAIPNTTMPVPASERDVWIEWGSSLGTSVGGLGGVYVVLQDVTAGAPGTTVSASLIYCPIATMPVTNQLGSTAGKARIGPLATAKTYALYGIVIREGGALAAYTRNLNGSGKTWIAAVAQ